MSQQVTNAGPHPNMFLNQEEIDAIGAKVRAGEEPWKTAYAHMLAEGDRALDQPPVSVTSQGDRGHLYLTEAPYCGWTKVDGKDPDCRDGRINPQADRGDYTAAITLGHAVRDLGLAYAFTGMSHYAQKALELMHVWTVHSATKMTPQFTKPQSRIELSITLPGMFYGADLIWNYAGWRAADKIAFQTWVASMLNSARGWSATNNFENWRLVFISSAASLLDDLPNLTYAFEHWKALLGAQVTTGGLMAQELSRATALSYSLYAINAMIQTAEIARHRGENLYGYTLPDGRGLALILNTHVPYVLAQLPWPHQQREPYNGVHDALFELAYSQYCRDSYFEIIQQRGRPMYEARIMGPTTLTHGNLFELRYTAPPSPNPPTAPLRRPCQ